MGGFPAFCDSASAAGTQKKQVVFTASSPFSRTGMLPLSFNLFSTETCYLLPVCKCFFASRASVHFAIPKNIEDAF